MAYRVKCAANLTSIYKAYNVYVKNAAEYNTTTVNHMQPFSGRGFGGILYSYVDSTKIFICPKARSNHFAGVNAMLVWDQAGTAPFETGSFFPTASGYDGNLGIENVLSAGTRGVGSWTIATTTYVFSNYTAIRSAVVTTSNITLNQSGPPANTVKRFAIDGRFNVLAVANDATTASAAITSVAQCSYGMSDAFTEEPLRPAIMFMDYTNDVIAVRTNAASFGPNTTLFARHSDKVNVVYSDGSAQLLSPATFDPGLGNNLTNFWCTW